MVLPCSGVNLPNNAKIYDGSDEKPQSDADSCDSTSQLIEPSGELKPEVDALLASFALSRPDGSVKQINKINENLRLILSATRAKSNEFFRQDRLIQIEDPWLNTQEIADIKNTQHLRRCLQSKEGNEETKQQFLGLAFKLLQVFKGQSTDRDASDIKEVIQLTLIADSDLYREIMGAITHKCLSPLLDLPSIWGLGMMIQNRPVSLLIGTEKTRDLNLTRLLRIVQKHLSDLMQQEKYQRESLSVVLQTISHLLDALYLVGINNVDYDEIKEPLDKLLSKLCKQSENAMLAWQAYYARYALAHLPTDDDRWSHLAFHFAEETVPIALLLACEMYLMGTFAVPLVYFCKHHFHAFTHLITSFLFTVPTELLHWMSSATPQNWYVALRFVDIFIQTGNLILLEKFVRHCAEAKNKDFLIGFCLRLEQLIQTHQTQPEIQQAAIRLLHSLAKDYQRWGYHQEVQHAVKVALVNVAEALNQNLRQQVEAILSQLAGKEEKFSKSSSIHQVFPWNINLEAPIKEIALLGLARKELLSRPHLNDLKDIASSIVGLYNKYFSKFKKNSSIKDALMRYIEPQGVVVSGKILGTVSLHRIVTDFLAEPGKRVLLLEGDAGIGKTVFCHHLVQQFWKDYYDLKEPKNTKQEQRIPLFIELSKSGFATANLVTDWLKSQKFSDIYIRNLQKKYPIVLILDGYEKFADQNSEFYKAAQLDKWKNAKIIITVAPREVKNNYEYLFCSEEQKNILQIAKIVPFSENTVNAYVEKYAGLINGNAQVDKKILNDISGLSMRRHHPFTLKMSLNLLPALDEYNNFINELEAVKRINKRIIMIERYDQFIEDWLSYSHDSLSREKLSDKERKSLIKRRYGNFNKDLIKFNQDLALELHQCNELTISYSSTSSEERKSVQRILANIHDGAANSEKEQIKKERLFLLSSPLSRNGDEYCFIHPALQDYFISRAICEPEFKDRCPTFLDELNQLPLMNCTRILDFLAERVKKEPAFKRYLYHWLARSEIGELSVKYGSSNAITILVRAGEDLSAKDLSFISIPYANLEHGLFDSTVFDKADLTGVNFSGAWLRGASFKRAKMKQAQFGNASVISAATGPRFIKKMELSADGHWLASYGPGSTLSLHSLIDRASSTRMAVASGKRHVIFSVDNRWAAWPGKDGDIVYRNITDPTQADITTPFKGGWEESCTFTSDSQYLIVPTIQRHFHDLSQEIKEIEDKEHQIRSDIEKYDKNSKNLVSLLLSWSMSAEQLLALNQGMKLSLENIEKRKANLYRKQRYSIIEIQFLSLNSNEINTLLTEALRIDGEVTNMALSQDGRYLFTVKKDPIHADAVTIERRNIEEAVLKVESIYLRSRSKEMISAVSKIVPSADGKWLALAVLDSDSAKSTKISLYSLASFKTEYWVETTYSTSIELSFSPTGKWLAIVQEDELIVLSLALGSFQQIRKPLENITPALIHAVRWQRVNKVGQAEEEHILTMEGDYVLRRWKIATSEQNQFKLELIASTLHLAPRLSGISIEGVTDLDSDNVELLHPFCNHEVPLSEETSKTLPSLLNKA